MDGKLGLKFLGERNSVCVRQMPRPSHRLQAKTTCHLIFLVFDLAEAQISQRKIPAVPLCLCESPPGKCPNIVCAAPIGIAAFTTDMLFLMIAP